MRRTITIALVGICVPFLGGCFVYNSLQSARLARPGQLEITPGYSAVAFDDGDDTEKLSNDFGIQFGVGVVERFNLRVRYERINSDDFDFGYNFLAFEPKFSVVDGIVALSMPFGVFYGEDISDSEPQFHPSLHVTGPVNQHFEVNGSAKVLIFTEEDSDNLFAFNLGVGIGEDIEKFVVRPELGFLFNPSEDGHFISFSIGATFYTW